MVAVFRSILAVLLGLILAGVVIATVEATSHQIYPPPEGLNLSDPEAALAVMSDVPTGALVFVLLAWILGSFTGGWLSARVADRAKTVHAFVVGGILMIAGILNMMIIPRPVWFWIAGLVVFLPFAYLGRLVAGSGVPPSTVNG